MQTIIEIKNLRKIYKDNKVALDDVNLNIFKGEIIALLGPNGAGKTTLISNICGISSITSGDIKVNGFDVVENYSCLLYTSPSPRDTDLSRIPSSA